MKTVSFKVKEDVYAEMQREADKYGLSISAWIRIFILEALSNKTSKISQKLEN